MGDLEFKFNTWYEDNFEKLNHPSIAIAICYCYFAIAIDFAIAIVIIATAIFKLLFAIAIAIAHYCFQISCPIQEHLRNIHISSYYYHTNISRASL